MESFVNRLQHGDCVAGMQEIGAGQVDLVFADPPFNIGYEYDAYDDRVAAEEYLNWSENWISAVHEVLKPNGTFWLAIGDDYAAELKLLSQRIGFHCRSWVVWYYTFGVNCSRKFTRSHTHLFHFVKDPSNFTFREDDLDNRVPSARELVYNDKRANAKGRLPDDTWIIRPAQAAGDVQPDTDSDFLAELAPPSDEDQTFVLRPQDLESSFHPGEDTWYFPRVAGTFKERAGFHGCQMPEQLLGRIIRTCSEPDEVVLDPFSGSATTLAVAKKLGRRFIGFDISDAYVRYGKERLKSICVGDRLDGSAEPLKSAPKTQTGRTNAKGKKTTGLSSEAVEKRYEEVQLELTLRGIEEAFRLCHEGFSADRVVADPDLNAAFVEACTRLGLAGTARTWNMLLFRLRKAGRLAAIDTSKRTAVPWSACDNYLFASEITLQRMIDSQLAKSLDEILCDPETAVTFDQKAGRLAPGYSPLEYRWAALRLRKEAKKARCRAATLHPPKRLGDASPIAEFDPERAPETSGLYVLSDGPKRKLYVGESTNLRSRLRLQFGPEQRDAWLEQTPDLQIQTLPMAFGTAGRLAWQSCLISKNRERPMLNYFELRSSV